MVWAITNIQMGYVSNCQRLPVFEHFFGIALEVDILELHPTKDDFLKKLRGEDVISVKLISPPFQKSTSINDLILLQTQTSHQRRFLDRMLDNGGLILMLASLQLIILGYYHTDFKGLDR